MDLLDLLVKIGVDDKATGRIESISSGIKGTVAAAAKGAMVAVGTLTTGVLGLTGAALNGYKEYEQLVGGVEKLYGKSADALREYAANAYKTAGMSERTYLETATQFSAAMTASLGGNLAKSAEQTDKAMRVISDNVNVFGSEIGSVTDAVKGFSKQNYTMLDNLKLGYGGTKQEMQRLLSDAEALSGIHYDISSLSDIIDAIEVIQTDMGITGTTAKEAGRTIEGSLNAAKAAWDNFVVALGREDADFGKLSQNLVDSLFGTDELDEAGERLNVGLLGNVVPRVEIVLENVGEAVLGGIDSLLATLGGIWDYIRAYLDEHGDELGDSTVSLIQGLADGLEENIPRLASAAGDIIGRFVGFVLTHLPELVTAGGTVLNGIVDGILALVGQLALAAARVVVAFGQAVGAKVDEAVQAGKNLVMGVVNGIGAGVGWVRDKITEVCSNALDALKSFFGIHSPSTVMAKMGGYIMQGWGDGIASGRKGVVDAMKGAADEVMGYADIDGTVRVGSSAIPTPARPGGYSSFLSGDFIDRLTEAMTRIGFFLNGEEVATASFDDRDRGDGKARELGDRGLATC